MSAITWICILNIDVSVGFWILFLNIALLGDLGDILVFHAPALRMRCRFMTSYLTIHEGLEQLYFSHINSVASRKGQFIYLCFSCNRCHVTNFFSPESVDDRAFADIRVPNNSNTEKERNKFILQHQYNINQTGEKNRDHHLYLSELMYHFTLISKENSYLIITSTDMD